MTFAPSSGVLPPPPRPSLPLPDDGHNGVPPTPPSSAPEDKSAPPIPSTSPCHLCCRLLFSPRPPPSRLVVSSVVAPNPDKDDNAVSVASKATTTAVHGLLPPGLGVALSLHHFTLLLLLVVVDVLVVISAPLAKAAASELS
jgi:hypothetical protein